MEVNIQSVLILEGVFIFRQEILPYVDVRIFIDVDFRTVLSRVMIRDLSIFGSRENVEERYRQKYIPGQELYLDEVDPKSIADVVIDNNDCLNPIVTFR